MVTVTWYMMHDHHTTATSISFVLLLATGIVSGISHCVGMCGPLVTAFAMQRRAQRQEVTASPSLTESLVIFQMGRLTTYLLIGAVMGGLGSVVNTAVFSPLQSILSIFIGILMILVGASLINLLPWGTHLKSARLAQTISGWMRHFMGKKSPSALFALGMTNGLLPCGPIYAAALMAASLGNPWQGASIMFAFGLGTLPFMLSMGLFASRLGVTIRSHLYRVTAVLIMLVGIQLMLRGLALNGIISHTMLGGVMLW